MALQIDPQGGCVISGLCRAILMSEHRAETGTQKEKSPPSFPLPGFLAADPNGSASVFLRVWWVHSPHVGEKINGTKSVFTGPPPPSPGVGGGQGGGQQAEGAGLLPPGGAGGHGPVARRGVWAPPSDVRAVPHWMSALLASQSIFHVWLGGGLHFWGFSTLNKSPQEKCFRTCLAIREVCISLCL